MLELGPLIASNTSCTEDGEKRNNLKSVCGDEIPGTGPSPCIIELAVNDLVFKFYNINSYTFRLGWWYRNAALKTVMFLPPMQNIKPNIL